MMETDQSQNGSGDRKNLTNLIINYLPQDLTDEEFKEIFVACGEVLSAKIIRDRATNYSHGYGFVEYSTPEEAQAAIEGLNGLPLQHKTIKVALARPPGGQSKNANLYVQGIPNTFNNDALQEIFAPYGEIVHAKVLVKADMTAKGDGFVLFKTEESAQSALNDLNGQTLPGGSKPMSIKYAMENKRQNQNQGQQGGPGGKYPPPPPAPGGRGGRGGGGGGGGGFGGPMRTRGGQQQNRFNPMQQRGGRGAGGFGGGRGGGRGAGGGWRGGQNNGNGFGGGDEGFYGADQGAYGGDGGFGGGYGVEGGFGGDASFGGAGGGGFAGAGGYDATGFGGTGGFGGGEEYYDETQAGQGFQEYPENGYQGYYDAIGFQGYQMPGQQRGRGARGGGRGAPRGGAPGGGRGGPRGGRGGPGAPRGRGRGGGGGSYSAPATGIALYVYNIGPNATDDDVMTIFSHYGSVTKVDVIMDYEKNVTKNYAFVHMSTEEEAETAISALNERYCMRPNHPMQVRYHQAKQKKQE